MKELSVRMVESYLGVNRVIQWNATSFFNCHRRSSLTITRL